MKKFFVFIISAVLILSICFSSTAANIQYTYNYGNVSVIFNDNTHFSEASRKHIADMLAGENGADSEIEPYGIACLFGHKYVTENVITITHCASDTQPRCLEEIFEISECSRCGKTKTERISYTYIACCP